MKTHDIVVLRDFSGDVEDLRISNELETEIETEIENLDHVIIKEEDLINNVKFLKGLFIIIFVAELLSLFELGFFLLIVEPQEKQQIINFIGSNRNKGLFNLLNSNEYEYNALMSIFNSNFSTNDNNVIYDSLIVLNIRENLLNTEINNYSIGLMFMVVILMFVFLIIIFIKVKKTKDKEIKTSVITGLLTITIICIFQYNMYQFGLRFQYPGPNEIMTSINNNVLTALIMDNETFSEN